MTTNEKSGKVLVWIIILILIIAGWFLFYDKEPVSDEQNEEMDTTEEGEAIITSGSLEDVSGGSSSGEATALFSEGGYSLEAIFSNNLPEPEEGYFYEGWVVRRGIGLSVISTGAAYKDEDVGIYRNDYTDERDLTDHDFYVLTLEPDDGDPAPAEHILEGVLQ